MCTPLGLSEHFWLLHDHLSVQSSVRRSDTSLTWPSWQSLFPWSMSAYQSASNKLIKSLMENKNHQKVSSKFRVQPGQERAPGRRGCSASYCTHGSCVYVIGCKFYLTSFQMDSCTRDCSLLSWFATLEFSSLMTNYIVIILYC